MTPPKGKDGPRRNGIDLRSWLSIATALVVVVGALVTAASLYFWTRDEGLAVEKAHAAHVAEFRLERERVNAMRVGMDSMQGDLDEIKRTQMNVRENLIILMERQRLTPAPLKR